MNEARNYYCVLGIEKAATIEEIKCAYRRLVLIYHPDRKVCNLNNKNFGSSSKDIREESEPGSIFQEIHEAYEILSNVERRTQYDILMDKNENVLLAAEICSLTEFIFNCADNNFEKICRCGDYFKTIQDEITDGINTV